MPSTLAGCKGANPPKGGKAATRAGRAKRVRNGRHGPAAPAPPPGKVGRCHLCVQTGPLCKLTIAGLSFCDTCHKRVRNHQGLLKKVSESRVKEDSLMMVTRPDEWRAKCTFLTKPDMKPKERAVRERLAVAATADFSQQYASGGLLC